MKYCNTKLERLSIETRRANRYWDRTCKRGVPLNYIGHWADKCSRAALEALKLRNEMGL